MTRRQTTPPSRWLIVGDDDSVAAERLLPRGIGILLLRPLSVGQMRRLRAIARQRGLTVVAERRGTAARVHDMRELRRALLARTGLVLVSPIFETASHPEWRPLPRMRAATLARLAGRKAIALGGMDQRRFSRVSRLGFSGWAGISAFRT
ncbi:MAG TPA: thiamine phosphate synthase [Sphingomicrobium sp.]|jgi:thiamine-phosphate pyrophosphorylase|nr:thiamine phosphate synthase [Sphingomicrobium sp.]